MSDLVSFLRARLDEDEQAALAASWDDDGSRRWQAHHREQYDGRWVLNDDMDEGVTEVQAQAADDGAVARHIARHDPALVLRDVEAKRKLLDEYTEARDHEGANYEWIGGWANGLGQAVTLLALAHADHPDYRPEWRP
ncbi:DUF6221 family protein [Streptomyces sp. NPDC005953]|uniref:DUF6221 family protein n=1 Tax=Streptomyces sp. NPDC005953 TaxID=3156719 RepID=UPI0033F1F8B6